MWIHAFTNRDWPAVDNSENSNDWQLLLRYFCTLRFLQLRVKLLIWTRLSCTRKKTLISDYIHVYDATDTVSYELVCMNHVNFLSKEEDWIISLRSDSKLTFWCVYGNRKRLYTWHLSVSSGQQSIIWNEEENAYLKKYEKTNDQSQCKIDI
jgi:hypothetical protein